MSDISETIEQRLTELARTREEIAALNLSLKQKRAELDTALAANEQIVVDMESALKSEILDYMQATGDLHLHPLVTFQRRHKLIYDKEEILAALEGEGLLQYIRTKKELDVRRFEADFKDGKFAWVNAEEVNIPVIALGGLGELLLREVKA